MDGTPRHRFDDGLSQRRPQQRRPGPDQQGQPSSIRLVVFGLRLEARLMQGGEGGIKRRIVDSITCGSSRSRTAKSYRKKWQKFNLRFVADRKSTRLNS